MTATADHPLVDGAGPGWAATETRAPVVALTTGMSDFLHRTVADGIRPLVVTDDFARLTRPLHDALAAAGGHWVVRTSGDGLYDARTGARLESAGDVIAAPRTRRDPHPAFARTAVATTLQLVVTASTRHRVSKPVRLGGTAETLAESLTGRTPVAWGATEPLVAAWDRDELTRYAQRRMPDDSRWALVGARETPFVATIHVARTAEGLEETTHAWIGIAGPGDERSRSLALEARTALAATAQHGMPLIATALAQIGAPDLTRRPSAELPPEPLALMIGPAGVRALGADVARMADEFGAAAIGSPRLPGLLFPLGTTDGGGWQRLADVLASFDPDRLAALLSLVPSVAEQLRAAQPRTGERGGPDGRPA